MSVDDRLARPRLFGGSSREHRLALTDIVRNPKQVGEELHGLREIMVEPQIYDKNGRNEKSCDYVGFYAPDDYRWGGWMSMLEIKASERAYSYAVKQLYNTKDRFEDLYQMPVLRMGVILYGKGYYERLHVL